MVSAIDQERRELLRRLFLVDDAEKSTILRRFGLIGILEDIPRIRSILELNPLFATEVETAVRKIESKFGLTPRPPEITVAPPLVAPPPPPANSEPLMEFFSRSLTFPLAFHLESFWAALENSTFPPPPSWGTPDFPHSLFRQGAIEFFQETRLKLEPWSPTSLDFSASATGLNISPRHHTRLRGAILSLEFKPLWGLAVKRSPGERLLAIKILRRLAGEERPHLYWCLALGIAPAIGGAEFTLPGGWEKFRSMLPALLNCPDTEVIRVCLHLFEGEEGAFGSWVTPLARHPEKGIRLALIAFLERHPPNQAGLIPLLEEMVGDFEEEVALEVLRLVDKLGLEMNPAVAHRAIHREKREKVRSKLAKILFRSAHSDQLDELLFLLADPDSRVVANAIEGLHGRALNDKTQRALAPLMGHRHNRVKANLALLFHGLSQAERVEGIVAGLRQSNEKWNRLSFLYVLSQVDFEIFKKYFSEIVREEDREGQRHVATAMERHGSLELARLSIPLARRAGALIRAQAIDLIVEHLLAFDPPERERCRREMAALLRDEKIGAIREKLWSHALLFGVEPTMVLGGLNDRSPEVRRAVWRSLAGMNLTAEKLMTIVDRFDKEPDGRVIAEYLEFLFRGGDWDRIKKYVGGRLLDENVSPILSAILEFLDRWLEPGVKIAPFTRERIAGFAAMATAPERGSADPHDLLLHGRLREAFALFQERLKSQPEDLVAWVGLAKTALAARNVPMMERVFPRAIAVARQQGRNDVADQLAQVLLKNKK